MRSHPPKHQIQHHRFKEYIRCHLYLHQGKSRFATVTMYWIIQSRHVLTYLFKGRWSPRTNRPFWVLKRKPSLWGTLAFPIFLPKDQRWDPNPRALRWVRSQEVGKIEVKPPPEVFSRLGNTWGCQPLQKGDSKIGKSSILKGSMFNFGGVILFEVSFSRIAK